MKNILIAGGAGFIGTNLTKKLLERNNKIICVDNFISSNKKNIEQFLDNKNYNFIKCDITNLRIKQCEINEIYNLACIASPILYQNKSIYTLETCFNGTKNLLELAKMNNAKFLQASTSEIYGEPLEHPQNENYRGNVNSFGKRSCYDEGKRVAEALCYEYKRLGVDIKIARIFNTYGPYMNKLDGRVIPNFIDAVLNDKPLIINDNGEQTRSFCYIDDLIVGLQLLMESDINTPTNIGNDNEYTINQLAEIILSIYPNTQSKITHRVQDKNSDDPTKRCPNLDKIKKLGYKYKVNLKQGLQKTIEYFKENE